LRLNSTSATFAPSSATNRLRASWGRVTHIKWVRHVNRTMTARQRRHHLHNRDVTSTELGLQSLHIVCSKATHAIGARVRTESSQVQAHSPDVGVFSRPAPACDCAIWARSCNDRVHSQYVTIAEDSTDADTDADTLAYGD
jgi:hypothetical protein